MAELVHGNQMARYDLEFKSKDDDAWYSVRVVQSERSGDWEDTLTVKFQGFPDSSDLVFKAGDFENEAAVDEIAERFRPLSNQLQDSDCYKVVKDMSVCAALSCRDDDLRFYDAIVDEVHNEPHLLTDGEEECLCTFVLCWLHGPEFGHLTPVNIAKICTIQAAAQADPRIASFSKLAKERIQSTCCKSCIVTGHYTSALRGRLGHKEVISLSSHQNSSSECRFQDDEVESCYDKRGKYEERISLHRGLDTDLGGHGFVESGTNYFVLIDNLESDLSTAAIRQLIHDYTCIWPQAYIYPRRSSMPGASGAIASASEGNAEKIYGFLINPKYLIVSARGRPWVISERVLSGKYGATHLPPESQDEVQKESLNKQLKVVHSGTEEFKMAKQLRDLFMDFVNHEQLLCKRLAMEETRVLKSSQSREISHGHRCTSTYEGC